MTEARGQAEAAPALGAIFARIGVAASGAVGIGEIEPQVVLVLYRGGSRPVPSRIGSLISNALRSRDEWSFTTSGANAARTAASIP